MRPPNKNPTNMERHAKKLKEKADQNRDSKLSPLPELASKTADSPRCHAFVEQRQTIAMRKKSPPATTTHANQRDHAFADQRQTITMRQYPNTKKMRQHRNAIKTPYAVSFNKLLKSFHQFITDSTATTEYYIPKNQDSSPWSRTGFNNMRTFCDQNTNARYGKEAFQQGLVQCCCYQTEQAGVHMIFLNNPDFYRAPILSSSIAPELSSLSPISLDEPLLSSPAVKKTDIYYRFDSPDTVLPREIAAMPDKIRDAMEIYRREMALIRDDILGKNCSLCVNLGIFAVNVKNVAITSSPHYLAVLSCNGKKENDFANAVLMRIQETLFENLEMPTFVIRKEDSPVLNFSWQTKHKRLHHEHAESLFALLLNVIDNCCFIPSPDGSLSIHTINPIDGSTVIDQPLSMFDATLDLSNQFDAVAGSPSPDLTLDQLPPMLPNFSTLLELEKIKRPKPLLRGFTSLGSSHDGVLSHADRSLSPMRAKSQLRDSLPSEIIKKGLNHHRKPH